MSKIKHVDIVKTNMKQLREIRVIKMFPQEMSISRNVYFKKYLFQEMSISSNFFHFPVWTKQ